MRRPRPSSRPAPAAAPGPDRRRFLAWCAAAGITAPAAVDALAAAMEQGGITAEELAAAERLAGLELTPGERELMLAGLAELRDDYRALRGVELDNGVPPATVFSPTALAAAGGPPAATEPLPPPAPTLPPRRAPATAPADLEELAFATVAELSARLRRRQVRAVDLANLYLARLERWDPLLECVVTLTRERALEQAERADRELDQGRWRGPLHGVPWGAKDLLAVRGYPTTWGAAPYRDQQLAEDAAVVRRLDDAGAVLVAKLTLGALAWGDVWFGGKTRNPWNPAQGSSGSSAGSSSAVAAGLVGFAVGSETWGSIVSPATRCGASGLRPTFGRVSRHGAMALSWSMDKLGPLARSMEDCALVLEAMAGADPRDPATADRPFVWQPLPAGRRPRVGWVRSLFEAAPEEGGEEAHANALAALEVVRGLGVEMVELELPDELPVGSLSFVLSAEAAAAFDRLTLSGDDDLLVRQIERAWPNVFRQARTIPAVEYIQANRVRSLLVGELERRLAGLDAYVVPSFGGDNLLLTNLTGHPCAVVPAGFTAEGTPTSISFCGPLWGEAPVAALADAYQRATDWHRRRPDLDAGWAKKRAGESEEAAG